MRGLHLSSRQGRRRTVRARNLFVLVCVFSVGLTVWFVPASSAHNSLVTVSLSCSGTASYTANAWAGTTSASRTNTDVRVFESTDNGVTWVQVGQGQFNQADRFSFSGTFSVGSSKAVRVTVQEFANWADGVKPGSPGSASATAPSNCSTTTTNTTTTATTTTATTTTATTTTATTTTATTTTPPPPTTPTTTVITPPPPATTTTATTPAPAATTTTTTSTTTTPIAQPPVGGVLATKKVKKVTATAKPAHPVVARSSFTG